MHRLDAEIWLCDIQYGIVAGPALLAVGAAAAVTSAVGAYSSAENAKSMSQYQSQVAYNNASVAGQNAQLEGAVGESQAQQSELQNRGVAGKIKAAQGANNITIGQGSAGKVSQSQSELSQLDSATIMSNAARQAYGFETQQTSDLAQGELGNAAGNAESKAAPFDAFSSLLGGASSTANAYAAWQSQNPGGPPSPRANIMGDTGNTGASDINWGTVG